MSSESSTLTGIHAGLLVDAGRNAGNVQLPTDKELVLKVIPMPADCNANGDIFGGWIMAQVDLAGAVLPSRIAKGRIATVAVNEFIFKQPVSLGDLLSFYARITRIGNTSIRVHVEVYAERNPANLHVVKVTEADLTYVAIDGQGQPHPHCQRDRRPGAGCQRADADRARPAGARARGPPERHP